MMTPTTRRKRSRCREPASSDGSRMIYDNVTGEPQSVPLSGTGVRPPSRNRRRSLICGVIRGQWQTRRRRRIFATAISVPLWSGDVETKRSIYDIEHLVSAQRLLLELVASRRHQSGLIWV